MDRRQFLVSSSALAGATAFGFPDFARAQAAKTAVEAAKKYAGTEIKLDGKEFLMMREDDILGVIES